MKYQVRFAVFEKPGNSFTVLVEAEGYGDMSRKIKEACEELDTRVCSIYAPVIEVPENWVPASTAYRRPEPEWVCKRCLTVFSGLKFEGRIQHVLGCRELTKAYSPKWRAPLDMSDVLTWLDTKAGKYRDGLVPWSDGDDDFHQAVILTVYPEVAEVHHPY